MKDYKRVKVRITGVVQGVGFRFFTTRKAQSLGVNGFVKNMTDGSVKIVAEGSEDAVNSLLDEVKTGPRSASVSDVDVEEESYSGEFNGFNVKY